MKRYNITIDYGGLGQLQCAESPIEVMEKLTREYLNGCKYKVEEHIGEDNFVDVTKAFYPTFHYNFV